MVHSSKRDGRNKVVYERFKTVLCLQNITAIGHIENTNEVKEVDISRLQNELYVGFNL